MYKGICLYRTSHVGREGEGERVGWLGIGRSWEQKDAIGDSSCRFKLIHFVMKSNWYYEGRENELYIISGKAKRISVNTTFLHFTFFGTPCSYNDTLPHYQKKVLVVYIHT